MISIEVKARVDSALRIVDEFDWEAYDEETKGEFADVFGHIVDTQGARGAARAGGEWTNDDPFVQKRLTKYVGDRMVELNKTTRREVKALVQKAIEDGAGSTGSLGDLVADLVREKFTGYEDWRADRIARSETGIAYNFGNLFGFRQAGLDNVLVSDGDEDEECAAADGQIWTIDEALANPLAHPNCERDFSPAPDDEE